MSSNKILNTLLYNGKTLGLLNKKYSCCITYLSLIL